MTDQTKNSKKAKEKCENLNQFGLKNSSQLPLNLELRASQHLHHSRHLNEYQS